MDAPTANTKEFMAGFEEAKRIANEHVQRARRGDADGDYRSISHCILGMKPGDDPNKPDEDDE